MTREEFKKTLWNAIVNVATMYVAEPDANLGTLTKNYIEHLDIPMTDLQMLGVRVFVQTHASNLANDERFRARVNVEHNEFIDEDSGEVVSVTRVTMGE